MTTLSVNVNKIALLRNSRNLGIPSVTRCAQICVAAGAHGITVHPRPDQRHIRPGDVTDLAKRLKVEFNIEGNPFAGPEGTYPGFMEIVRAAKPTQATLVPDDPGQLTSDHGWDLTPANRSRLAPLVREMKALGIRVSLFMDAEPARMRGAADLGADRVELYTEPYARAFAKSTDLPYAQDDEPDAETLHKAIVEHARDLLRSGNTDEFTPWSKRMMAEFGDDVDLGPFLAGWYMEASEELRAERESIRRFAEAAQAAGDLGLGVNAGHDLSLENLGAFVKGVPGVLEVSIGHALVTEALEMGLERTVKEYIEVLSGK